MKNNPECFYRLYLGFFALNNKLSINFLILNFLILNLINIKFDKY